LFVREVAKDRKIRCGSARINARPVDAHHIQVLACSGPLPIASAAILNPGPLPTAIGHLPFDHGLTLSVARDVHAYLAQAGLLSEPIKVWCQTQLIHINAAFLDPAQSETSKYSGSEVFRQQSQNTDYLAFKSGQIVRRLLLPL
jgi:hypothetical protein